MMDAPSFEARHNADPDIASAALQGADVRIYLHPDETVAARIGTESYVEALELPHVVVVDDAMWASQRNATVRPAGPGRIGRDYYAYYTGCDIFASNWHPEDERLTKTVRSQIMSTGRYKTVHWRAAGRFEPVYDSANPERIDALVDAIEACARFKVRLDFEEGHSQIHPVVFPFHYPESDEILADTELQFLPAFMREPKETLIERLGEKAEDFADAFDPVLRERTATVESTAFSSFYRVYGGGVGKRLYDLGGDRLHRFARTIIFAEI